jgi:hypothetical protein
MTLSALICLIVMARIPAVLAISEEQRVELSKWASSRTLAGGDVFRARLILALADGQSYRQIKMSLQTTAPTISRWKHRFEQYGIAGLDALRKAASRGSLTQRCKPRSHGEHCRNHRTAQPTGRAGRWRRPWA